MPKPNFFLIGASKCGTSSLYDTLGRHPQVLVAARKELDFFAVDSVFARGLDWYERQFASCGGEKAIGDGSGRYSMRDRYPSAAPRIARYKPEARILYLVRHPLRRMESHWIQKLAQGDPISTHFPRALREDRHILVDASNYWRQIQAYRDHFPDEQILVLFFEDLVAAPAATLCRVLAFLDVDPDAAAASPERRLGATAGVRVDTARLQALRRLPLFRRAKAMAPEALRSRVKERLFRRVASERPRWDAATRRWVLDVLSADLEKFLGFYGKPPDFWELSH